MYIIIKYFTTTLGSLKMGHRLNQFMTFFYALFKGRNPGGIGYVLQRRRSRRKTPAYTYFITNADNAGCNFVESYAKHYAFSVLSACLVHMFFGLFGAFYPVKLMGLRLFQCCY